MEEVQPSNPSEPTLPPFGTYSSRCDEKGRVRIPEEMKAWMLSLPDQNFFVTTIDRKYGRVYPASVWRRNRALFHEQRANPLMAGMSRVADFYGSTTRLDNQGRILISPALRREMRIEEEPILLRVLENHVVEFIGASYQEAALPTREVLEQSMPEVLASGLE